MIPLAQLQPLANGLYLSSSDIALRLLSVLLLITINAFFVAAEFSIVSVRQSRINQLASGGDVQARTVQDLQRSIERLLSTAQLGITLSSLALGWIGEHTMAVLLQYWLQFLPIPVATLNVLTHSVAVPVAFFLIAYLQIVLGELCPKSVAMIYPEQLARFLGPPSLAIARVFNPFIWVLNQSTRMLLRMVGIRTGGHGWYSRITPEELQLIIQTSSTSPDLEEEERELLNNVLEFADVTVREVMVPRISIVAIQRNATFKDVLHEVAESGHSRYPIIAESLDQIDGVISFKDLAEPWVQGQVNDDSPLTLWIRPVQFVPEHLPLNELLHLMQQSGQSLVMVADEYGGTAGLVTLKDLASEIIGESKEPEGEEEEPMIQYIDERTVLVQAQMNLEEVNEMLSLAFPLADDYQTLGGFLIHQLQKIPAEGELLRYENLELQVTSAAGPRLQQIQIERLAASEADAEASEHRLEDDTQPDADAAIAHPDSQILDSQISNLHSPSSQASVHPLPDEPSHEHY